MVTGILLGFGAAACQSLSYVFSKRFTAKHGSVLALLSLSHVFMGVFSLALAPFYQPAEMPLLSAYAPPLVLCALFYLAGQLSLFMAMKTADASRLSPLLGLKVLFLALFYGLILKTATSGLQWAAVALSVVAAFLLSGGGARLNSKSLLWILSACVNFCASDYYIRELVSAFSGLDLFHASIFSVCLSYLFCGLLGAVVLLFLPRPAPAMWRHALPFSLAWFAAMLFLYGCFGSIGVVYGNIIQSTRGIISILFGAIIAKAGYHHIERHVEKSVVIGRVLAALLMSAAIALFNLGH